MSFIDELRSFRIGGIAVFDVVASMYGCGALNKRYGTGSFKHGALAAIPLGVAVHWLLGINTQLNNYLGISDAPTRQ
jgi:hypothetical protein